MSQVRFLKGLFSVFLLSSFVLLSSSRQPRAALIGAGLSDLTVALDLQDVAEVTVFEARQRPGGRVLSIKMPGGVAELGAFNIRDGGPAQNIMALIKELGLAFEDDQSIKYFDGVELVDCQSLLEPYELTASNLKEKIRQARDGSESMADVLEKLFPGNEKLQHIFSIKFAGYEGAVVEKLSSSCCDSLYYMLLEALSLTNASFSDEDGYQCRLRIKGGNSVLIEKMVSLLKNEIQYGKVLEEVTRNEDGTYHLSFKDGSVFEADIVVLTVPCPVYATIKFADTILSAERQNTIASIRYGMNSKVLYPAKHPQVTGAYTNGRMIASYNSRNSVITAYYIDEFGKFDADTIADVVAQDRPFLSQVYKFSPAMEKDPVMAEDKAFVSYTSPVGYSWSKDPYALGSYSCIGVGQDEIFNEVEECHGEQVKKLFAPVDGTFFFAGEATTILADYYGTLEAAVESGKRTARLIKKIHGLEEEAVETEEAPVVQEVKAVAAK